MKEITHWGDVTPEGLTERERLRMHELLPIDVDPRSPSSSKMESYFSDCGN